MPRVCTKNPHCHGCWLLWRRGANFAPLSYPTAPARGPSLGVPDHVAAASLSAPFLLSQASDGAGRTLLLGTRASILMEAQAARGLPRPVVASRLQCLGMYVGDALRTREQHHERCSIIHDEGSHAVAILNHVLCAAADPKGIALLCEGGWVNAFLHVVELHLDDGSADGKVIHAAFAFAAEDIYQESELRILYDDDRGSYQGVREARGYTPAPRDPRGPADFSAAEVACLPDYVWRAFAPEALALALSYGGVEDYGALTADRNVTREPGTPPPPPMATARRYDPSGFSAALGCTAAARDSRAARRNQLRLTGQPPRPRAADELEEARGRRVTNTEDGDAVDLICQQCGRPDVTGTSTAHLARCADHDYSKSGAEPRAAASTPPAPSQPNAVCQQCGTLDTTSAQFGLCSKHHFTECALALPSAPPPPPSWPPPPAASCGSPSPPPSTLRDGNLGDLRADHPPARAPLDLPPQPQRDAPRTCDFCRRKATFCGNPLDHDGPRWCDECVRHSVLPGQGVGTPLHPPAYSRTP